MRDFVTRVKEYRRKTDENAEVFSLIIEQNQLNPNIDVIQNPQTIDEVEIADTIFTYFADTIELFRYANDGNLDVKDYHDNYGYNLYYNIIDALKSGDKAEVKRIKDYISEIATPKEIAQYLFDLYCCLFDLENFVHTLMNNLGLDIENEKQLNQFMLWMNEAKSIISIDMKPVIFRDLSEEEKKYIERVKKFIREYHLLLQEEFNKGKTLKQEK